MKIINSRKYLITYVLVLLLFASANLSAKSVGSIKGIVYNKSTKTPINNVNIYLAYTMIGTTSDADGYFEINNIPQGNYEIVFSHVNFKKFSTSLKIIDNKTLEFNVPMTPKIYELDAVPIVSDVDDWKDNLEIFKERIIGTSSFAEEVELLNPEIIDFSKNKYSNLVAKAGKPLEFINNALGYKITYYLEYFEAAEFDTKYSGFPIFKELNPPSESIREEWENNRRNAYLGSLRHFLTLMYQNYDSSKYYKNKLDSIRSLTVSYNNEIDELTDKFKYFSNNNFFKINGFIIARKSQFDERYVRSTVNIDLNSYLSESNVSNEFRISNLEKLSVRYNGENPDKNYEPLDERERRLYPTSSIVLLSDTVNVDKKGRYFDKFMIRTYGYWAFERLAETVPYEYKPDNQ